VVFVAGVRPPTGGGLKAEGAGIMRLTTMTQVTIDGVMQEAAPRRMRTAGTGPSAA